jgi:hypothetical protein
LTTASSIVDDVVGDDVEEMPAINEIAQRISNQIEVSRGVLVGDAFMVSNPSTACAAIRAPRL